MSTPVYVLEYQIDEIIKKNFDYSNAKSKIRSKSNARKTQELGLR